MTAASIFTCVIAFLSLQAGNKTAGIGIGMSMLGVGLFGFGIVVSARTLLAGALQLDRNGFQVTLFGRKQYLWAEVSDFRPYRFRSSSGVQFDAVRPRSRYISAMNACSDIRTTGFPTLTAWTRNNWPSLWRSGKALCWMVREMNSRSLLRTLNKSLRKFKDHASPGTGGCVRTVFRLVFLNQQFCSADTPDIIR